ncbi:Zn(II)2Cys6 transcription factor domain-containing protein [Aspergillus undulatus]|uniref:Zn(II)2Cys6 transcription factor domain-containing protein n=1 Tax=Aspergillus undulatus TaxID=1810928 RepID=UPI003CCE1AD6
MPPDSRPINATTVPIPAPHSSPSPSLAPSETASANTQPQRPDTLKEKPHSAGEKSSKLRPITSCAGCRVRKVKCNKAHPCAACIARNQPGECTYASTDEDRSAIAAADLIAELRGARNKLQNQVARKTALTSQNPHGYSGSGSGRGGFERVQDWTVEEEEDKEREALEAFWSVLRGGEMEEVREVVGRIRAGEEVGDVLGVAVAGVRRSIPHGIGTGSVEA